LRSGSESILLAEPVSVGVNDASAVGEARRRAGGITQALGFNETAAGEVAIAATELANNVHRHGQGGEVILQPLQSEAGLGLEILAVDRGPGIADIRQALSDGFSTGGTSGTGLGAARRMAQEFDVFSEAGKGTIVMTRFWPNGHAAAELETGAVCLRKPGEDACGDAWAMTSDAATGRTAILVADGLGHGAGAAQASRRAIEVFHDNSQRPPGQIVERLHAGLRGTRGAAVAVVEIWKRERRLNFAGLGNIAGVLLSGLTSKNLVSHNGTAGVEARRVQEFPHEWTGDSLLVMHSDGLAQHWSLASHRGLMAKPPSVIAGLLYRDHRRVRDDVTVLVARETAA